MAVKKRSLKKSIAYWNRAVKVIMDGTQLYSKGPMINVFGVAPTYLQKGKGGYVWDVDGNKYIDYTSGVGSVILGYGYPDVKKAIIKQLEEGSNLGLIHPLEVELAETLCKIIPCAEMVRFLKTGSDACAAAVRIARAYTGKEVIIKGEYHGWHDWAMARSKRRAGIPKALYDTVYYAEYNILNEFKEIFSKRKKEVAAVILEAVQLTPPENNFLENLKELCKENKALLIFDEVVTGFRFGLGGAQEFFNVIPDLAVFGKGIANGMPLSCVVGRREIFEKVKDKIFISTTFGGEMLSISAALANIKVLKTRNVVKRIWKLGEKLQKGTNEIAKKIGIDFKCIGYPPRVYITYKNEKGQEDVIIKSIFLQEAVKRGVLMAWQMFPMFMHKEEDIERTLKVFEEAMVICKEAKESKKPEKYLEGPPVRWVEVL